MAGVPAAADPLVEITQDRLDAPRIAPLVAALELELQVRYDDEGAPGAPLDPAAFVPPNGVFLLATVDGQPAGCGGLRRHGDGVAEVKRMYVAPDMRGLGLGRRLLAALEDCGRELGYARLLLETGTAQPEAIALYTAAGWTRVPPYGEFRDSPMVRCFTRDLQRDRWHRDAIR